LPIAGLGRTACADCRVSPILAKSEADTIAAGRNLARGITPGTTVLLHGELGAGKTAFVRGLAEGLGLDPELVSSPTFTIVQEYRSRSVTLQHVDLYRLTPLEVVDIAIEDLQDGKSILAIEWAERLPQPPVPPVVQVRLEHVAEGRQITIETSGCS
jgi:tRNA threonylcarbamoyladenosine biosynthesis protein TsaE